MQKLPISNAVGYFHWPPIWIGEKPFTHQKDNWNDDVLCSNLTCGIRVRILQRGGFVFDFSKSCIGNINPNTDWTDDEEIKTVKSVIFQRVAILNAHLVCLYSALNKLQSDDIPLRKMVVNPSNMFTFRSFLDLRGFSDPYMNLEVQINAAKAIERSQVILLNTVDASLQTLDMILLHPEENAVDLVRLYHLASKMVEDHDYALSLITSWSVTERLIYFLWNQLWASQKTGAKNEANFNKEPSASSVIRQLLSRKIISQSLCDELNYVREHRNAYIHRLQKIEFETASQSLHLTSEMLLHVYRLNVQVPLSTSLNL